MVIRGRDGHHYDFATDNMCLTWKNLIGLNLYRDPTIALHRADAIPAVDWLGKSRCIKDDNRHSVITNTDWFETMKRYSQRSH
jgi:hypothetical protein